MSEKKPKAESAAQFGDEEVTVIQELGWFVTDNSNREQLRDRLVKEMKASQHAATAIIQLQAFFTDVIRANERAEQVVRNDAHRFVDADPECPRTI